MRKAMLLLLVGFALIPACKKDKPKGGSGGGGGGGGGGAVVDKAKLGAECKQSFDCGNLDFDAECSFDCVKPGMDDTQPGYCQLQNVVATAGATGCYGNRLGVERSSSPPSEKVTTINYCDMNAGFYCNMGSHACEAVKAIGAACEDSAECGKDGACQNKACVAAGAPGAAAVEGRCASSAYRKGDQCIARVADGGPCEESDQCQSMSCEYGAKKACVPAKPKKTCSL